MENLVRHLWEFGKKFMGNLVRNYGNLVRNYGNLVRIYGNLVRIFVW